MTLKLKKSSFNGNILNIYENKKMTLGYSENKFKIADLQGYFQDCQIVQLKQTHSSDIWLASEIKSESRGGGIILKEKIYIA